MTGRPRVIVATAVCAWLALVTVGFASLHRYDSTPGDGGDPQQHWPAASVIKPVRKLSTLILFAHPQCPCTRASLAELERIMAHGEGRVQAFVVFLAPSSAGKDWARTDLWDRAAKIPGVTVVEDIDGVESRRFRVATSGHALLYNDAGERTFSGGITSARGHEGSSVGSRSIVDALVGLPVASKGALVFGCSLNDTGQGATGVTTSWKR